MRNITRTEETIPALPLKESELRYRRLFESAQEGILILDARTGMIEDVNPYLIKMLGYSREEFIKKKLWEVGAFKDIEASQKSFEALQENEYMRYENLPLKAKDGRLFQVEFVSNVYLVDDEKVIQCDIRDITEHKRIISSLQENEKKYHDLVDQSPDGAFIIAFSGKILTANQAMCRELGFSEEELLKMNIWDIIPEQYVEQYRTRLAKILQGESLNEPSEYTVRAKDGRNLFIEVLSAPYYSDEGMVGFQGIARDITRRKHADETLQESERRYRSLFENSLMGISFSTTEGHLIQANQAYARMFGYGNPEEIIAGVTDIGHQLYANPEDRQELLRILAVQGFTKPREMEMVRRGGARFFILVSMWEVKDAEGKFLFYQANQIDISERKQAEATLLSSEEKYRSLVDEVNDGFYISDEAGIFTFANPALARMYGVESPQALVGRKFSDFLAPEAPAGLGQAYGMAMQTGSAPTVIKGQVLRPDGSRLFIEVKPTMILKAGQVIGTRGVVRDITERKRAEEKIQQQLEHLIAVSAIERIIASVFNLELSLSEILIHIKKELGVDAADILTLNPNSHMLEFGAESGFRTDAILNANIRLGEGHAGRAAMERHLVQIPNLASEPEDEFLRTLLKGENFTCYFGIPLIAKGQVKGVLGLYHRLPLAPDAEWFDFLNTLAGQAALAIENSSLFESLQRSNLELAMAYDATIEGWSHALDLRDKETEGHTQRVTSQTVKLAGILGLSETELVQVRRGALLHDIGKMGVPDGILLKPGPLTDEEWVAMKKHPTFAYQMLAPIRYLRLALDIPYCHHEKWDGQGYPRGLKGEQIPLAARIFAVVDVWDALISDRPYRQALPQEEALQIIRAGAGTHFDPQVVKAFLESGLNEDQK
jgi:PAS domain S-box-containing protein